MKLLVTGGAGFIGSHIVEQALADPEGDWTVAVLDDLSSGSEANLPAGVPLFQADIRDPAAVLEVFRSFSPDVVSHQAAQVSVARSMRNPANDASINVLGGLNVLDAAVATGVRRLIFASSGGAVYGEVPVGHAVGEYEPCYPISPYAVSKLAFELYLEPYRHQYGLETVVLRYANVYGPRQSPHGEAGVVSIFAEAILAEKPVSIYAARDGSPEGNIRDYVYVGDVARANIRAASGTLQHPLYNIGTGQGRSTEEVASTLIRVLGKEAQLQAQPYRDGDLHRSVLDSRLIWAELGEPVPFEEGIQRTTAWYHNG